MPRHKAASCGSPSMTMWRLRSLTTALVSLPNVARAWAFLRCTNGPLSWGGVALSTLSQRAVPKCWSVYRYQGSEEVGDPTYPHRRRPSSFQEGHDLLDLIGARVRSCRRGQN